MPSKSDYVVIKEPDFTQRWFLYLSATLLLPVLYLVGNHTSNVPLIAGLWSVARASFVLLILGYILFLCFLGFQKRSLTFSSLQLNDSVFVSISLFVFIFLFICYVYISVFNVNTPPWLAVYSFWIVFLHIIFLGLYISNIRILSSGSLVLLLPTGIVLCGFLVLAELTLHIASYGDPHFVTDYELKLKRPAKHFHGIEHSHWVYHKAAPLKRWFVETNALGWREVATYDHEDVGSKLMLLGDSVTYGWGVSETSTLPYFLFQELASLKTTKNWSVLNRSVPNWSTYDQFVYWRSLASTSFPDIVVINVVMNDFIPETDVTIAAERSNLVKESFFSKRSRFFRLTKEWLKFLIRKRSLNIDPTQITRTPATDLGRYKKDRLWYIRGTFNSDEKEQLYAKASRLTYRRLEQLSRSITESGSIPVFAIFPASAQVSRHYWVRANHTPVILEGRAIAEITSWMKGKNFRFLNLLPTFRQSEEYPLFIDSFHLSPEGNRVAANKIFQYLQNSGLLE